MSRRADAVYAMPLSSTPRIVVIGAGPTGLGAAYRLRELGHKTFRVYERDGGVGGLASSFTDDRGFTWDVGGHVLFSHYAYFDRLFEELMRGEYTLNQRESWVRACGAWVPYPFQNNIRYLPKAERYECLTGLVRAQMGKGGARTPAEARTFAEFNAGVFGDGICRLFMTPYNFKVWAHPPEMMSKAWIGERVAVIDVERAIRNVVLELDDFGWGPNNRFKFPLRGTGDFYRRFEPLLDDRLTLNKPLRSIDPEARVAEFADGERVPYDELISTIPLDILCRDVLGDAAPASIRGAAARLRHAGGHIVGVGIRRPCPSTRCWMYFPEADCPFYRVTYLSNYSPLMTPDKDRHYSLLCETSTSEHKPVDPGTIVEDTIRGLVNTGLMSPDETGDIVSLWHKPVAYTYPVPTVDRDEALSEIIPWLERRGIHSRGRFGLWKYEVANTDHSVMQGVELVNRLLLDEPETTIGITYRVTEDGRRAAVHERPAHAGSGEKRLRREPPEIVVRPAEGPTVRP